MSEFISPLEAQRFIENHYGERAGPLNPLGSGDWSRAYAFELDGREVVVRFGAYAEDFAKDRIMAAFSSPRLPIPETIELGEAKGGFFAVSERRHGTLLDELDEAGMRVALPGLLVALDAVRDIDVSDRVGYGIWGPDGVGPHHSWQAALLDVAGDRPRIHGWRAALEASPIGAGPFEAAFAKLRRLVERLPGERHVVHGDLLYHNVLVQGANVSAVIDWGNSLYGDHLYDAAWLLYWWPWYPAWSGIDIRAELDQHWAAHTGSPADLEDRLLCYRIHIGLDAMTYNASTGRWDDLEANAEQTLAAARSSHRGGTGRSPAMLLPSPESRRDREARHERQGPRVERTGGAAFG